MYYMLHVMTHVMMVDDYEYKPNHFTEMSCQRIKAPSISSLVGQTQDASHVTSHMTSRTASRVPTGSTRPQTKMSSKAASSTVTANSVMGGGGGMSSVFAMSVVPGVVVTDSNAEGGGEEEEAFDPSKPNDHPILKKESLMDNLRIAERAVTQNVYQSKQARYRDLPVLPGERGRGGREVERYM